MRGDNVRFCTAFASDFKALTASAISLTSYVYDDLGHRISENSPDSGLATYTYDAAGNLLSKIDARGTTVIYSYDALNRLTAESYPDTALNVSYSYDQGTNGIGRLTGMTDAAGTTLYHNNELGQLTGQERVNTAMAAANLAYGYDPVSAELASLTYPSGLVLSYTRDAGGRISSLSADGQVVVQNIIYKPFGPVADYVTGNSLLTVNRAYDLLYRLEGSLRRRVKSLSLIYIPGQVSGNAPRCSALPANHQGTGNKNGWFMPSPRSWGRMLKKNSPAMH